MTNQQKYKKLINIRTDLTNDADEIGTINRRLDEVISDFKKFAPNNNGDVVSRVSNFREPYQSNDSLMIQAKDYVQFEINSVNGDIKTEEAAKAAAKAAGGGGGSW